MITSNGRSGFRALSFIALALLCQIMLATTTRAQSKRTTARNPEIFNVIKSANERALETGIFTGRRTEHQYASSEPMTQKELKAKLAAKERELWNDLKAGKLLPDSFDEKLEAMGVSSIAEALKIPEVREKAERMIEYTLGKYEQDWIERDTESKQVTFLKMYLDSTTEQLRIEEWFEKAKFEQGDAPQNTFVCNEGTKLGLLGKEIGTINRSRNVFWGALRANVNPLSGGTVWIRPNFRADHVHSVKTEASAEGPAMEVVFVRDERKGTRTFMQVVRALPEKGYRAISSEIYMDGVLDETVKFSNYKEIEPGLWYPLKQVRTDIKATLPGHLAKRLKTGFLGDLVEEVRNSQIITQRTEKSLELSEALVNKPIDKSLFKLAFPDGIEVYDYSREDEQGRPFVFISGK